MEKYTYEFTEDEVNYLLNAVNSQKISGMNAANSLLFIITKLQKPFKQNNEIKKNKTDKKEWKE